MGPCQKKCMKTIGVTTVSTAFADGYPYGLTPEILNTEILPALQNLTVEDGSRVDRSGIFTILSRDINSFDVETEIAPPGSPAPAPQPYRRLRAEPAAAKAAFSQVDDSA